MDTLEESKTRKTSSSTDCDASNAVNSNCTGYRMTCDGSGEAFTVASNVTTEASSSVSQTNNAHNIISQQSVQLNESASDNIKSVNNLYHPQIYKDPNVDQVPCSSQSVGNFSQNVDHNDVQGYQKQKLCMEHCGNNNVSDPSTSGTKVNETNQENSSIESRKRPSTLKLNKPNFDAEDSSSDTGNDDYSLGSEDGCIYTYRGGEHLADLPSSFFSLDMGLPLDRHLPMPPNYPVPQQAPPNPREQGSRASSPDMDFLEMDFDPGPSCEVDSGDESTPDVDLDVVSMPEENEPIRGTTPEYLPSSQSVAQPVASTSHAHNLNAPSHCLAHSGDYYNMPSTSSRVEPIENEGATAEVTRSSSSYGAYITHINVRGEHITVRRTMAHWPPNVPSSLHVSSGDLVSPREILNYEEEHSEASFAYQINQGERPTFEPSSLSAALYHMTMAKKLMVEKDGSDVSQDIVDKAQSSTSDSSNLNEVVECVEVPLSMVWSEREACERQVTQIGTSACGATAVVNVFIALGVPVNVEKINASVGTRQRANNAPLPRYILSRAVAGCTAADLVTGIQKASDGLVTARFFPTYPERAMSLSHWLADWISLGAVPILTLNLQVACEGEIPDAWHHQMVFGVSSRGIYLCNPAECVSETAIWPRLASPSVLLVKTKDVLSRFTPATDLRPLMAVPDRRFHSFNVLGQVVNVVREWRMSGWSEHGSRTRHIRIPASYQAGITVAALTGSEAHRRLMHAPQLPVLAPQSE